jgi:hypothetical protein
VATLLTLNVAKMLTPTSFVKNRAEDGFLVNILARASVDNAALASNILHAVKFAVPERHALTYARKLVMLAGHAQPDASSRVPTVASMALVKIAVKMPAIPVSNMPSPVASMSLQILSAASPA